MEPQLTFEDFEATIGLGLACDLPSISLTGDAGTVNLSSSLSTSLGDVPQLSRPSKLPETTMLSPPRRFERHIFTPIQNVFDPLRLGVPTPIHRRIHSTALPAGPPSPAPPARRCAAVDPLPVPRRSKEIARDHWTMEHLENVVVENSHITWEQHKDMKRIQRLGLELDEPVVERSRISDKVASFVARRNRQAKASKSTKSPQSPKNHTSPVIGPLATQALPPAPMPTAKSCSPIFSSHTDEAARNNTLTSKGKSVVRNLATATKLPLRTSAPSAVTESTPRNTRRSRFGP